MSSRREDWSRPHRDVSRAADELLHSTASECPTRGFGGGAWPARDTARVMLPEPL